MLVLFGFYWAYIELEILPDPTTSDEKLGDRGLLSSVSNSCKFFADLGGKHAHVSYERSVADREKVFWEDLGVV